MDDEEDNDRRRFRYPRPYSEPPSPGSSRPTTPGVSIRGSDGEEEDEVDEETEVIKIIFYFHKKKKKNIIIKES